MKQPVVIERATLEQALDLLERAGLQSSDSHAALSHALSNPFIAVSERLPENEEMKIDLLLGDGSILASSRHDGGCAFQHRIGFFYSAPIISGDNHPLVTHWRATEVV
jgi:hypothetical protein